jgi:hypothetical protein
MNSMWKSLQYGFSLSYIHNVQYLPTSFALTHREARDTDKGRVNNKKSLDILLMSAFGGMSRSQ